MGEKQLEVAKVLENEPFHPKRAKNSEQVHFLYFKKYVSVTKYTYLTIFASIVYTFVMLILKFF